MLPLIQNTIATNGAHFAPVWAAMHQNTNINLINIRFDLEKMENRMPLTKRSPCSQPFDSELEKVKGLGARSEGNDEAEARTKFVEKKVTSEFHECVGPSRSFREHRPR